MLQLSWDFLRPGKVAPAPAPLSPPPSRAALPRQDELLLWKHGLRIRIVRQRKARRYLLRLQPDGIARLVIPSRGSQAEAMRFLERSEGWLLKQMELGRGRKRAAWVDGTKFLYRGEEVTLRVEAAGGKAQVSYGDQTLILPGTLDDYRAAVLSHLRSLAEKELPERTWELAKAHGITISRVTVRSQKTRWGSCSARGTISLNWRLIQAPAFVVDYLVIHELMHRREMNHSSRYWKLVEEAFPTYRVAEAWLKKNRLEASS